MAKRSTEKGKVGEREFANVAKGHGLDAYRSASLQAGQVVGAADVAIRDFPELHVEVKRDERMSVDAMVRQAEAEAQEGSIPVVAYRRNGQRWGVRVPADHYLSLLAELRELRAEAREQAARDHAWIADKIKGPTWIADKIKGPMA